MDEIKYTTTEGDEIVRDGEYETRAGERAVIVAFVPQHTNSIVGYIKGAPNNIMWHWHLDGTFRSNTLDHHSNGDLIRPWRNQKSEGIAEGLVAATMDKPVEEYICICGHSYEHHAGSEEELDGGQCDSCYDCYEYQQREDKPKICPNAANHHVGLTLTLEEERGPGAWEACKDCGDSMVKVADKKVYKLSEMWKIWCGTIKAGKLTIFYRESLYYPSYKAAKRHADKFCSGEAIAITPADAQEFYEGEGLEDPK